MALANPHTVPDRQPSPNGLSLNLPSNNPFRNRANSPSPRAPDASRPQPPTTNKMSNNPFLDASELSKSNHKTNTSGGPGSASDIFKELSLLDKPDPPIAGNAPPARAAPRPKAGHRATGSEERRERPRDPRGLPRPLDGPQRRERPHQRRASASSVMDREEKDRPRRDPREREPRERERERGERPVRTESEERRRRERRKEREERHRREKEKIRNGGKSTKKAQGLDIIDKLDVTGIYGPGLFHHDGPFDACNPHRNARKDRRAPMQAFPTGSANMALGGSGPVNSRIDLEKYSGRGEEGFADYGNTRKTGHTFVSPTDKIEQIHADETYGLGTSTFLEGARAPGHKPRESDDIAAQKDQPTNGTNNGGGITRKKSLAQRFRGMSASRRNGPDNTRSPEARYHPGSVNLTDSERNSPPSASGGHLMQNKAMSAGGPMRAKYTRENEVNVFEENYDAAFERKGQQIRIAEQERPSHANRRPSSPLAPAGGAQGSVGGGGSSRIGYGLTRSVTSDSATTPAQQRGRSFSGEEKGVAANGGGGGFLSRMKSLKGGKRARPERRES